MRNGVINIGLRLQQPFANYVVEGKIPVLFRTTITRKRGKIHILSTKSFSDFSEFSDVPRNEMRKYPLEKVVGTVEIESCISFRKDEIHSHKNKEIRKAAKKYPWSYVPSITGYAWILKNPIKFKNPKKYKNISSCNLWMKNVQLLD